MVVAVVLCVFFVLITFGIPLLSIKNLRIANLLDFLESLLLVHHPSFGF